MQSILSAYADSSDSEQEASTSTPSEPALKRQKLETSTPNSIDKSLTTFRPTLGPSLEKGRYISKREREQMAALQATPTSSDEKSSKLATKILDLDHIPTRISRHLEPAPRASSTSPAADDSRKLPKQVTLTLSGHSAGINCVKWSPGYGQFLASASMDNTVKIWDPFVAKKCVLSLEHHTGAVKDVQWSADGRSLLSCGFDSTARLCDVETGTCTKVFEHTDFATVLRYHPFDENIFVSGTTRAGLQCWDIREGKIVRSYKGTFGQVQDLEFLPDGKEFVVSSDITKRNSTDKALVVFDFESAYAHSNQIYLEAYTCPSVRIHPTEHHFVAQSNANYIALFSTRSPFKLNKRKRFEGHQVTGYRIQCNISPDGQFLTTGSADGSIFFYDWATTRVLRTIRAHGKVSMESIFHPVLPGVAASCSWDGNVCLLE